MELKAKKTKQFDPSHLLKQLQQNVTNRASLLEEITAIPRISGNLYKQLSLKNPSHSEHVIHCVKVAVYLLSFDADVVVRVTAMGMIEKAILGTKNSILKPIMELILALVQAAIDDIDARIRIQVLSLLRALAIKTHAQHTSQGKRALDAIFEMFCSRIILDCDPIIRLEAMRSLALVPEVSSELWKQCLIKEQSTAVVTIHCGALLHGIEDESEAVRMAALKAISLIKSWEFVQMALPMIIDCFIDEHPEVRLCALQVMLQCSVEHRVELDSDSIEAVACFLEDQSASFRSLSCSILESVYFSDLTVLDRLLWYMYRCADKYGVEPLLPACAAIGLKHKPSVPMQPAVIEHGHHRIRAVMYFNGRDGMDDAPLWLKQQLPYFIVKGWAPESLLNQQ